MTAGKTNGTTSVAKNENDEEEKKSRETKVNFHSEDVEDEEITPEDLAPDGGWGWVITLAMIVTYITINGPAASFAIVFGDFLEATGQAGTAMTLFNSVFMVTFSAASLMTNALLKKYSMRKIGVVGALLYSIPNVIIALVDSIYEIAFICLIQGFGLGLVVTICNTNFNAYFVKKRTQVMSAAHIITGLGTIVYPILIEKMMGAYGFRGTAAMTGALSLNAIVGMSMMHPVEWHAKKPSEIRAERAKRKEELKLQLKTLSNRRSTIDVIHVSARARSSSLRSLKEDAIGKDIPLLIETLKLSRNRANSTSESENELHSCAKRGSTKEPLSKKLSSLSASSLVNLVTGLSAATELQQLQIEKRRKQSKDEDPLEAQDLCIWSNFLETSLLKDRSFMNISFGINFILTSDYIFSSFLPLMMANAGYTKNDAAHAVTISASAELVSRILLAIFTFFIDVKAKYLFFGAMICMGFAKLGYYLYDTSLTGSLVMIALIGAVRSWLLVPQSLVIMDIVSIEKFAAAYGIFTVISGIVNTFLGPIVGLVKDWTNSYAICQILLLIMSILFIVPWGLEFLFVDLPKKRKEVRSSSRKVNTEVL